MLFTCLMRNTDLLFMQCMGIGPYLAKAEVSWIFSSFGGNLAYILELRRGQPFKNHVCSATSGHLSSYEGHLGNLFEAWQGNRDTSRVEAGDPGSLSSSDMDIEIPTNFQEESRIFTFRCIELHVPLEVSKRCEASCRGQAGTYVFLWRLHWKFTHPLTL